MIWFLAATIIAVNRELAKYTMAKSINQIVLKASKTMRQITWVSVQDKYLTANKLQKYII